MVNKEESSGEGRGARRWRARRAGFTLVELMVTLALLGLVMMVVFSLFSSTSAGLKEADSLASTVDQSRFALEQISRDVKNAGAFSTSDSRKDSWVIDQPGICVSGVASYDGWQDPEAWFAHNFFGTTAAPNDLVAAHTVNQNLAIGYDGFILMGAIDIPQTFEVNDVVVAGNNTTLTLPESGRGVLKLLQNDLFSVELDASLDTELREILSESMPYRLLRVADRDGNLQFGGISNVADDDGPRGGLSLTLSRGLQVRGPSLMQGIEPQTRDSQDVGYEAALVDAFWYRVEPDPAEPRNFRLVRYRLNADGLSASLCAPNSLDSEDLEGLARDNGSWIEKSVIADRVADFQVWFDCANADGNLADATWPQAWANPNGEGGAANAALACMNPAAPNFGAARMAHIRLSLRTRDERQDAPVELFLDETGAFDESLPLRYFDLYPDAEGAARVVTVQADIELSTFGMRNVLGNVGGSGGGGGP